MRSFLASCALLCATSANAADTNDAFAIKGAGLQDCRALTQAWDSKSSDLPLYLGWIDGYLTGMNQHLPETFDSAPWQTSVTLLGLTRNLCAAADADARVIDVFNALMKDFRPARVREKSAASAVSNGAAALVLYTETIARLQRRLAEEGYDPGPADGEFRQKTVTALGQFQVASNLPETGLPDQQTLFALFVRGKAPE